MLRKNWESEINRIWESVHTLSKRQEEILRLLDLLKAEKEDNKMLCKVIEEKNALIKELCTAVAKPDSTFGPETNNNQDNKWEKLRSPAKRAFPPTWEPTTSNRFDCLNVEDESKHDLDSNDPIQIQLTNVKLKRKIQYLQSKVKDSQPTAEDIATGKLKPRTTSAKCLPEPTNAISHRSQSLQEEQEETLYCRSTGYYRSSHNMHKKRNNDVYIVGDLMLNGLDERKMKKGNCNVKVRAHPGITKTAFPLNITCRN